MTARLPAAPRRALVITLRYIGDVLLCTPFVHALARRYPGCAVDMLVFKGTEGILQGNPDVAEVITVPEQADRATQQALIKRLWRKYDLSIVMLPSDRPHLYNWAASGMRYGYVPAEAGKAWWKRLLLRQPLVFDDQVHRVPEGERLARHLGLGDARDVVAPSAGLPPGGVPAALARAARETGHPFDPAEPYAIVHPSPRWRYKQWHAQGWRELIVDLAERGLRVLISGGPGQAESDYLDKILSALPDSAWQSVIRVQGLLSLAELADLLRDAALYVGPDTATTHLAAVCGTPTVALFGPTDPLRWGPWPKQGLDTAWQKAANQQQRGKVILLQNLVRACVPCQQEGCEGHRDSHSDCLDALPAERVIEAAHALLPARAGVPA